MSFVSFGNNGGNRPTFFELIAADRLLPSLKDATIYSLSVFAQRHHAFHRLLNYEDEMFALFTFLLNKQSLSHGSGTFSESLYGLRRAPLVGKPQVENQKLLNERQQRMALITLVGLPYLHSKLYKMFEQHSQPQVGISLSNDAGNLTPNSEAPSSVSNNQKTWSQRLQIYRHWALFIFLKGFPFIHTAAEGLKVCYQMLYLLEQTAYFTPVLRFLGQHIVRVSAQEMLQAEGERSARRRRQLRSANRGSWLLSRFRQILLQAGWIFTDHSRNALIFSVFVFKILEWWYNSAEQKLSSRKNLPQPPAPPPLRPHPDGVGLPANPADCAICKKKRTNPTLVVPSGFVFCYPCIFHFLSQHGHCPVTRIPASVDQIRRLYYSQ